MQEPQKVADYVIQFLRTYLEHIAARIYAYENPNEQVPIRGKDKWYTQYMNQGLLDALSDIDMKEDDCIPEQLV